jgi:hypothetical protein
VTGYEGGVITYEVISYVDAASNVKAQTDSIISQLGQTSTTDQIADVANSSPGCCTLTFQVFQSNLSVQLGYRLVAGGQIGIGVRAHVRLVERYQLS